jgi:DNA polymerase-3 subunit alpha
MEDRIYGVDNKRYHLVLLCKDRTGYENLCYLVSQAFINGFYGKPRVDLELLEKHHEGLIALSACLAGGYLPG